ncbi:hypothetical protein [Pseudoruegeria sp. SK021]|uniref:hypothetical protein n=1 Tax=Pseudoruegeria sp. SK021 TaxID=1933035 RepID=UPI00111C7E6D|nr:hypothetical protein [Pseudoruegeria sp. SK021]
MKSGDTNSEMNPTEALRAAVALRNGLLAWEASDEFVGTSQLAKAFRDDWDRRIGTLKFGGVWSIGKARQNLRHPYSKQASLVLRSSWNSSNVTVEHAVPVTRMFWEFRSADTDAKMTTLIEAYQVAVVTREEDNLLRAAGFSRSMPEGWQIGRDDPQERWKRVGIEVETA